MSRQSSIVGDIGGTNTRLGWVAHRGDLPSEMQTFRNCDFASFDVVLRRYFDAIGRSNCGSICLAVAAPIDNEFVTLTNCDWQIDSRRLQQLFGASAVYLLNDLEALALSLPCLRVSQTTRISGLSALRDMSARKLVVGAGTGFNAASIRDKTVLAAECGHMTLPVQTLDDLQLRDHLAQGRGRASVERALSGKGLCEIYAWMAHKAGHTPQSFSAQQIAEHALNRSDQVCEGAAKVVLRLLATVAGDLALAYLPYGGIYLAGSICRSLAPMMSQSRFAEIFAAKGRQSDFMQSFPIHLITDDAAALLGCAAHVDSAATMISEHSA